MLLTIYRINMYKLKNVSINIWLLLYLPAREDKMKKNVVYLGGGSAGALKLCRPLHIPQMWKSPLHKPW